MTALETLQERSLGTKVTIERRNAAGEVVDLVDLEPSIFGITPNVPLMHQVVTAQLASRRSGTQSTKTRSEVAGGGAKPYRQKGTGRARQGTVRAPQYVGGGVALGPKPRSYAQRTPRKMIRLALHSALSDRAAEGRVCLLDEWSFELPKTKEAVALLRDLGLSGRVLVVLGPDDTVAERSFSNLQHVHLVEGAQLTAYEVLAHDWVLFTSETIPGGVTVSSESGPTVGSVAVVEPQTSAGAGVADTSAPPAPAGETAPGADEGADDLSGGDAAGDEAGTDISAVDAPSIAGVGAGEGAGAGSADTAHAGSTDGDDDAVEPAAAAVADAEARAHDAAVRASREAAEALAAAETAEPASETGPADESANEDEEDGR